MPNLFGGNSGRIVAVETGDTGYIPLGLVVSDFKVQLGAKAILTGMSVSGQSAVQRMHTLRQYLYIYTFGERSLDMTINGLSFVQDCTADAGTGLARLYDWYELNRISHTGAALRVVLTPELVVDAFLTGFRYQMEDPSISLGQFALQLFFPARVRSKRSGYMFPPASLSGAEDPDIAIV